MKKVNLSGVPKSDIITDVKPKVLINGAEMATQNAIEFRGDGVSAYDDAENGRTVLTISSDIESTMMGNLTYSESSEFNSNGASFTAGLHQPVDDGKLKLKVIDQVVEHFDDSSKMDIGLSTNVRLVGSNAILEGDLEFDTDAQATSGDFNVNGNCNSWDFIRWGSKCYNIGYDRINVNTGDYMLYNREGFAGYVVPGDVVLLINRRGEEWAYENVGKYEFLTVLSVNAITNEIVFTTPIKNWYGDYAGTQTINGQSVWAYVINKYRNVTLNNGNLAGHRWRNSAWGLNDGYGIIVIRASQTITLTNYNINLDGCGFCGGYTDGWYDGHGEGDMNEYYGSAGAGMVNDGNRAHLGSGGGNASAGGLGGNVYRAGAQSYGYDARLRTRIFNGGGGGNGSNYGIHSRGGDGGGILIMIAPNIVFNGVNIRNRGLNGSLGGYSYGFEISGGGGAGGSNLIVCRNITMGTNNIQTNGGSPGGVGSGSGGNGRTAIFFKNWLGGAVTPTGSYGTYTFVDYKMTGTLVSKELVSGLLVNDITNVIIDVSDLPANTVVTFQYSKDGGTTWKSAAGVTNAKTTLAYGHNVLNIVGVGSTTSFKYRLEYTSDGLGTPKIDRIELVKTPINYTAGEQEWKSPIYKRSDDRYIRPKTVTFSWTKPSVGNATPKFKIQGSNDPSFVNRIELPASGKKWENGTAYNIENGVPLNIDSISTAYYRYWRIVANIDAGGDVTATPTIDSISIDYVIQRSETHMYVLQEARRHVITQCAVDSNGHANFLSVSAADKSLIIDGTSVPLILSFSVPSGTKNYQFNQTKSLFNFSANATSYLFAELNTVSDEFSFGFSSKSYTVGEAWPAGTTGDFFFHLPTKRMYYFTGGSWVARNVMFIGQVSADASGIPTSCVSYAVNGKWTSNWMDIAPSTVYSLKHNLGINNPKVEKILVKETTTGAVADMIANGIYATAHYGVTAYGLGSRTTINVRPGNYPYWDNVNSYATNIQMFVEVDRGWL